MTLSSAFDTLDADLFVRDEAGEAHLDLVVEGMHCAGCMQKIERALSSIPDVIRARCNLSTKRVAVSWKGNSTTGATIIAKLDQTGFTAIPFDSKMVAAIDATESTRLLRAMGVAGFAAANVMLLSVSVWSGFAGDMEPETRSFFHWLSALIALPAVAYAGQPFFRSARKALRATSMNMDVPISLAVLLACAMSLVQTIQNADHVYFDASISLLFFLLIGRYLDVQTRAKACAVAQNLLALRAVAATLVEADGSTRSVHVSALEPGMIIAVAAGQRLPADGVIINGTSDIDTSLVTGESLPLTAGPDTQVFAGMLNLSGPLRIRVTAKDDASLLSEIVRLMEAAEQGRAGYVRLADRIARIYAPAVHILAAGTVLLWLLLGAGWQPSVMNAIAVLIITCPCALGLAVPVVQVVASGRLLKLGILVKTPDALERLADIDAIVFDKTGTLTLGKPELINGEDIADDRLALAAALARESRHPLARAVVSTANAKNLPDIANVESVSETPGYGLEAIYLGNSVRLGSRRWVGTEETAASPGPELWLRVGDQAPLLFSFSDQLRPDAATTLTQLAQDHSITILSGDTAEATRSVAVKLHVDHWEAEKTPVEKISLIEKTQNEGHMVLMVGDGLNDAPALKAAHVSMSPASAADISQTAADFVFQSKGLDAVTQAIQIAKQSRRLILQNFGMALGYNLIAVPLAMAGYVTPLIAAIAMSASSLTVTLNALRLGMKGDLKKWTR